MCSHSSLLLWQLTKEESRLVVLNEAVKKHPYGRGFQALKAWQLGKLTAPRHYHGNGNCLKQPHHDICDYAFQVQSQLGREPPFNMLSTEVVASIYL